MALDTLQKRASAAGLMFRGFIIPDGSIDAGERQTLAGFYSGILAALPFPIVTPDSRTAAAYFGTRIAAAGSSSRVASASSSSRVASAIVQG